MLWKREGLGEYDVRRPLTPTGTISSARSSTVDGHSYRRTIRVKGDGLVGPRVHAYYYRVGDEVDLVIRRERPGAVRTATRWSPPLYEWAALFATSASVLLLLTAMRARRTRRARRAMR